MTFFSIVNSASKWLVSWLAWLCHHYITTLSLNADFSVHKLNVMTVESALTAQRCSSSGLTQFLQGALVFL